MVSALFLLVLLAIIAIVFIRILKQKPEIPVKPGFILENSRFARNKRTGEVLDKTINGWCTRHELGLSGHSIVSLPRETTIALDFTSPPGGCSGLYYSLCFQLRKWEYHVQKLDEWVEVSPVHQAYYQLTQKQKEDLEAKIKSGLASSAQAVADLELLKHDERKYREFLNYFGMRYNQEKGTFEEDAKNRDDHSIKAMFIDQVDVHSGDGISMRSIVSRWPTLITDFMKLSDEDLNPDKIKDKLDVSKAEAVVLTTKNKVYQQWKRLFEPQLKERYSRIMGLVKSREKSVEHYREWLRPYIARHMMIDEALSRRGDSGIGGFKTGFIHTAGSAVSSSKITLFAWRELTLPDVFKGGTERLAREIAEGKLNVEKLDKWTLKNLIFHPNHGLITKHKWITEEWVEKQRKWMYSPESGSWLHKNKLYYSCFIINLDKINIRSPTGSELEDGVFDVNSILMSNNALFVKLLEIRARQEDMDRYIDELMGIEWKKPEGRTIVFSKEEYKKYSKGEATLIKEESDVDRRIKKLLDFFGISMSLVKRGPYERDFIDRLTKYWSAALGGQRYRPIVEFIKRKMSMGE